MCQSAPEKVIWITFLPPNGPKNRLPITFEGSPGPGLIVVKE
jgi:hypothetical protein